MESPLDGVKLWDGRLLFLRKPSKTHSLILRHFKVGMWDSVARESTDLSIIQDSHVSQHTRRPYFPGVKQIWRPGLPRQSCRTGLAIGSELNYGAGVNTITTKADV